MPTASPAAPGLPAIAGNPLHLRITCALLASAARLVPVPFLDDILRQRLLQLMVARTLRAHGRHYPSANIKPLWAEDRGCLVGCLLALLKLPVKLILLPIRKIVAVVGLVHGVSQDLTEVLLLGRALDRCLSADMLGSTRDQGRLQAEAVVIRTAFDQAVRGMDLKVLKGALAETLSKLRGLAKATATALRALFRRRNDPDAMDLDGALPASEKAVMEQGASQVEEVLARPEIVALLERFDRSFDGQLARLQSQSPHGDG